MNITPQDVALDALSVLKEKIVYQGERPWKDYSTADDTPEEQNRHEYLDAMDDARRKAETEMSR